jgi:hypothetical protein
MNASLRIELAPIDRHDGELIVAEVLGNGGSDKEVTLIDSDKQGNTNKNKGVLDDWL